MAKENTFAFKSTANARLQLQTSFNNKRPRMAMIRKMRALYNNERQRQFRVRYSAPLPIFAGMVDTLQADLNDDLVMEYEAQDPADWRGAEKCNAALLKESTSMRPDAQWSRKFRIGRQEVILTGVGIFNVGASKENGYRSWLNNVVFEDFHFEPYGGSNLENHLFTGQANIWITKSELIEGAKNGLYDRAQVDLLTKYNDSEFKYRGYLQYDEEARFRPLGLSPTLNNWVGEPVYNMVQWEFEKSGRRYHELFEYLTGTWVRFEKLEDINSSGLYSWVGLHSHEDAKNFASKGFGDDLYPHAITIADLVNEEIENHRRRNSNARAYDKDMFTNLQELQEAQQGRDALVRADTKGGTRRIADGIYAFETPEIKGTIDLVTFLSGEIGKDTGVNDIQQGAATPVSKKATVAYLETQNINKRLAFNSQPMIEAGKQIAVRFFAGLKDYLSEPLSIRLLGESGYQWDELKRIDLNLKRDFEISVSSKSAQATEETLFESGKEKALEMLAPTADPAVASQINPRVKAEYILRHVGRFDESEISMMLDTAGAATKKSESIASAAIQDMMQGRMPKTNYEADGWFLDRILKFVRGNMGDKKVKKNFDLFMQYVQQHEQIAVANIKAKAQQDFMLAKRGQQIQPPQPGQTGQPPQEDAIPPGNAPPTPSLALATGAQPINANAVA